MSASKKAATAAAAAAAEAAAASTAVTTTELEGIDIGAYAGAGLDTAGAESFAIPFLRVLQPNSPEVDEAHAKFIERARPGMLYNTVTGDLFDGKEGALFVPCHYERKQLRWAPRGSSASYRGEVTEVEAANARAAGKLVDHEGRTYFTDDGKVDDKKNDRLVDTRLHFGLMLDKSGVPHQVLLSLTSTQIKKSKLFNSMQRERTRVVNGKVVMEPAFLYAYRITSVKESNDRGSWYGVHFALEGQVPNSAVFQMGAAFYEALKRNEVKVNYAEAGEGAEAAGGAASADPERF
jgi:hypothetical protein